MVMMIMSMRVHVMKKMFRLHEGLGANHMYIKTMTAIEVTIENADTETMGTRLSN